MVGLIPQWIEFTEEEEAAIDAWFDTPEAHALIEESVRKARAREEAAAKDPVLKRQMERIEELVWGDDPERPEHIKQRQRLRAEQRRQERDRQKRE